MALVATVALALPAGAAPSPEPSSSRPFEVREIELDTPRSGPSIVTVAPDQSVWVSLARASKLLRVAPDGSRREFTLPEGSFPVGLLVDPQGVVWYGDIRKNQVVRFEPTSGAVRGYDLPTKESWPFFLARDARGRLYFTERVGNKLGRLDPATGRLEEFPLPTAGAQPAGLTITPDNQVFFTQNSANQVGHFDPATGRIADLKIPSPATPGPHYGPAGIASDAHGNVWFCELDGRLGLIRHDSRDRIEEFPLPDAKVRPGGVVADRFGLVWFTGLDGNMIGSFHPGSGTFRSYALPSGAPDARPMSPPEVSARGELPQAGLMARSTRPFGIAVDAAGKVWFAEQYGHRVGYVVPPRLDVLAPAGSQSEPTTVLTLFRRGLEGEWKLRLRVDEQPFVDAVASLDLTGLEPGVHTLEVVAERAGTSPVRATSEFVLRPGLAFLERALTGLAGRRSGPEATAWTDALHAASEALRQGRSDRARERLRDLRRALPGEDAAAARLRRSVLYVEMFGGLAADVQATQAGCQPAEVTVQPGDRVRWSAAATGLRAIARDGSFASPPLGARPWARVFAREGRYEYACGDGTAVVSVEPRRIDAVEAATPGPGRVPTVLVVDLPRAVWAAAGGGGYASLADVPLNNKVLRLAPDGKMREYATPTPESAPTSIKMAPDRTLWFTLRAAGKLGHLDPESGTITEYDIPTPRSAPTGIAVSHDDGTVWFTEKQTGKVGRFDPRTQRFEEFVTPHEKSEPSTVVLDHEGQVWFDERGADFLVRMNPRTLEMTTFRVPTKGSRVVGLVPDERGYMWFLELAGHKVGRLDVKSGQVIEYTIPTRFASPFKAVLDRHGRLWFTQAYGNRIAVLQDGHIFEYALAHEAAMPGGIEIGEDGALWFTLQAADLIAHVPDLTELYVPLEDGQAQEPSGPLG